MSARSHFVKELSLAAARVAQSDRIIAGQRRHIARLRCKGGNIGHAEDILETMLDVRDHYQDVHYQLLHALLTTTTRPAMAF
jgi:hypothetical protein